jgi:hypothetical protein
MRSKILWDPENYMDQVRSSLPFLFGCGAMHLIGIVPHVTREMQSRLAPAAAAAATKS